MPSFTKVWRTGSGDCSTSRMISSFSATPYLIRRRPQPDRAFFQQAVLERELSHHFLRRAGRPAQLLDLVRSCRSCSVAGWALLAGLQKFL